MPVTLLSGQPVEVQPYDVLGIGDPQTGLLVHAMLCNESGKVHLVFGQEVSVVEMGPPLEGTLGYATVAGSAQLSDKQKSKVKAFADTELMESEAARKRSATIGVRQYVIHKSYMPPSKELSIWRYSCVGFVLRSYRVAARINLLKFPSPLRSLEEIKTFYPTQAERLGKEKTQNRLGLGVGTGMDRDGVECWPIDLAGYLFHSLNRDLAKVSGEDAEPYQPLEGDEYFPRQADEKTANKDKPK